MSAKTSSRYIGDKKKEKILRKLKSSNPAYHAFVKIAFETGLRANEIPHYIEECKDKAIGDNIALVPLKQGKRDRYRHIEVLPEALELVGKKVNVKSLQQALFRLGMEFSLHDCRKTYVTNLASWVTNPYTIAHLMGWASINTAMEYIDCNQVSLSMYRDLGKSETSYDANINYYEEWKETEMKRRNLEAIIEKLKEGQECLI